MTSRWPHHVARGRQPADFALLHNLGSNAVLLDRDLPQGLGANLANTLAGKPFVVWGMLRANQLAQDLRQYIADRTPLACVGDMLNTLASDMTLLIQAYMQALPASSHGVMLRLENMPTRSFFHRDGGCIMGVRDTRPANVRLLCAYAGPGTLWLAHGEYRTYMRRQYGYLYEQVAPLPDQPPRQLALGNALLFKTGPGSLVHAAPSSDAAQPRLLMVIDSYEFGRQLIRQASGRARTQYWLPEGFVLH